MMRKILFMCLFFILSGQISLNAEEQLSAGPPRLLRSTFVPVNPAKAISTSVLEEGDILYFIVPTSLWIDELVMIPENSVVMAEITMLKMPITGVNATMNIYTKEVIFPSGEHYPIKGAVAYKGERQIGGDLTPPLSYNKSLHTRKGEYYNGVISQYVPSGKYEFGQHITIMPGETLYIILDEDFTPY